MQSGVCPDHERGRRLAADPDSVAPWRLARFRKSAGAPGALATLAGHLEAGQIEWRVTPNARGLEFAVESWARGGDRLSAMVHDHLPMAKEVQLCMWTSVAERVARSAGGRLLDGVWVRTRRVPAQAVSDGLA